MAGSSNLHDSAKNKQDEFYTRLDLFGDGGGAGRAALPKRGRGRAVSMKPPPRKDPYKIVITEVKDENGDGRVEMTWTHTTRFVPFCALFAAKTCLPRHKEGARRAQGRISEF